MVKSDEQELQDASSEDNILSVNTDKPMMSKSKKANQMFKLAKKKVKDMLDGYGASGIGPALRAKTWIGGIVTTVFRLVVLGVIAYNLFLLFKPKKVDITGDLISLNYWTSSENYMSSPTMQLKVTQSIKFYEQDSASLQRIIIREKHGFEKVLTSSNGSDTAVPIAKAKYSKIAVPLNTFDKSILGAYPPSFIKSQLPAKTVNLGETSSGSLKLSSLITDTLMLVYLDGGVFSEFDSDFHPHTSHLFIRFKEEELSQIKPCQLQVGMINLGQYNLLLTKQPGGHNAIPNALQSQDYIFSYATTNSTWAFEYGESLPMNMVYLSQRFDSKSYKSFIQNQNLMGLNITERVRTTYGTDMTDFHNWAFFINYVNNFNTTYQNYQCDATEIDTLSKDSTFFDTGIYMIATEADTDLVYLMLEAPAKAKLQMLESYPKPFYIVAGGLTGVTEVMKVLEITKKPASLNDNTVATYIEVRVQRDTPVDFSSLEPSSKATQLNNVAPGPGAKKRRVQELNTAEEIDMVLDVAAANGTSNVTSNNATNSHPNANITSGGVPPEWTCSNSDYNTTIRCDCGCGAVDPDCTKIMANLYGHIGHYNNLLNSKCTKKGQFCSSSAECFSPPMLYVGLPCFYRAGVIGSTDVFGFFGSRAEFENQGGNLCHPCPNDPYFDNTSQYSPTKKKNICYPTPKATLDLEYQYSEPRQNLTTYNSATGETELACLYFKVRIPNRQVMFPTATSKLNYPLKFSFADGTTTLTEVTVKTASQMIRTKKEIVKGKLYESGQYDYQELCLAPSQPEESWDTEIQIGQALLRSYISSQSEAIIVSPTNIAAYDNSTVSKWYKQRFGSFKTDSFSGDFKVRLYSLGNSVLDLRGTQEITLDVSSVTNLRYEGLQLLTLSKPPSIMHQLTVGTAGEIVSISNNKKCVVLNMLSSSKFSDFSHSLPLGVIIRRADNTKSLFTEILFVTSINATSDNEVLCFSSAIKGEFYPADTVEMGRDNSLPAVRLAMSDVEVEMIIESDDSRTEYLPSEIHKMDSESPSILDAEVAVFIVPDRVEFTSPDFNLCPSTISHEKSASYFAPDTVFSRYKILADRVQSVQGCSLVEFNATSCKDVRHIQKNIFDNECINEMHPSYVQTYEHVTQMNNKWWLNDDDLERIQTMKIAHTLEPEYEIAFQHEYMFTHDQESEEVETQFNQNMVEGGDTTQEGQLKTFYGKMEFGGKGVGTKKGIPGNSPILNTKISIELSPFAAQDAKKSKGLFHRLYGTWAKAKKYNTDQLKQFIENRFVKVDVPFDLTQVAAGLEKQKLQLRPGTMYTLQATLALYSNYTKNSFSRTSIEQFGIQVVTSSVTQQPVSYPQRNKCIVVYKFIISDQTRDSIHTVTYNLIDFLASLGGALGLFGIGMTVLSVIQKIPVFTVHSVVYNLLEEDLKMKKKKKNVGMGNATVFPISPDSPDNK